MQFEQRELNQRFDLLSKAIWVWYTAGLTVTEGFYRTGNAKGRCRSSARRWPCYRCTAAVPVRLCHELFSISTKPGAQLHSGNEWGETRRQNGGWAMVACGRRGNREGRRCWGHAVGSPEEVGKQEALGSYDTSWDFSWVGATCAWRWSLIVSGDAWIKTAVQFLLFLSFFFFFLPFNKWLFVFPVDLSAHLSEWVLHLGTAERHWLCSATPENPYMLQRYWAKFHFESCCKCSLPGTKSLPQTVYTNSLPWYLGL